MPAPSRPQAWKTGAQIGRYTILGHLASGGMAEVYLARPTDDPTGRKLIALKRIAEGFNTDEEFVAMFLDEARVGVQLTHPHLIRTYGLERDGGSPYLALEYLSGESLQDIIEVCGRLDRPIPEPYLARWIADAAAGLHHAHEARNAQGTPLGIVHRDISPHNLFVTYRGKVKVVDFGIAQAANKSTHTQTGYVKGKLAYLSPEQVRQQTIGPQTDVFALGIVLFEGLTLGALFPATVSDSEIVRALAGKAPLERARSRQAKVSLELDRITAEAMAMRPSDRYPTAEAFQHELEAWLAADGHEPTEEELGQFVRDLFPQAVQRKEALVRASLRPEQRGELSLTDEATATDLDLLSHPDLVRLASEGGRRRPAPVRPRFEPPAEVPTRIERTAQGEHGPKAKGLSNRFWVGILALGLGSFALTIAVGSCLGHR